MLSIIFSCLSTEIVFEFVVDFLIIHIQEK